MIFRNPRLAQLAPERQPNETQEAYRARRAAAAKVGRAAVQGDKVWPGGTWWKNRAPATTQNPRTVEQPVSARQRRLQKRAAKQGAKAA